MQSKTIIRELRILKNLIKKRNLYRKRLLSISEAARISGVSKSYIQKLVASKRIPYSKPTGKLVFIHRKDLENFLSQNYIKPTKDVEMQVADYIIKNKKY